MKSIYDYSETDEIADSAGSKPASVPDNFTMDDVRYYVKAHIFPSGETHTIIDNTAESLYDRWKYEQRKRGP